MASAHVLEQQERQEKIKSALDYANQEVEDAVERAATEYKVRWYRRKILESNYFPRVVVSIVVGWCYSSAFLLRTVVVV